MSQFSASVIICTYNRAEQLVLTLKSLNHQKNTSDFEVIIVDDGSSINTKKIIDDLDLSYSHRWFWQQDDGFRAAKARNTGILFSNSDLIIFLDDDMIVPDDFVEAHIDFHDTHFETVAIGYRNRISFDFWHQQEIDAANILPLYEHAHADIRTEAMLSSKWLELPWAYCATCNLSAPKKALVDCGLFDEHFQHWGLEDTELALRLHQIGMNFKVMDESIPIHLEDEQSDLTKAISIYHLPPAKMEGYWQSYEYFRGKYSDHKELIKIIDKISLKRMLVGKGVVMPSQSDVLVPDNLSKSSQNGSLVGEYETASSLSLLNEKPQKKPSLLDSGSSVLDDVRNILAISSRKISDLSERILGWGLKLMVALRYFILSLPVLVLCMITFMALVFTGRYRRIFRRQR